MSKLSAKEIEITLADGKVLHFSVGLGDNIVVQRVDTYAKEHPSEKLKEVVYYTIYASSGDMPLDEVQKEALE